MEYVNERLHEVTWHLRVHQQMKLDARQSLTVAHPAVPSVPFDRIPTSDRHTQTQGHSVSTRASIASRGRENTESRRRDTFAGPQRCLGEDDVVAGKVPGARSLGVGQQDVAQVPLVGEVPVPHGDADREDLADRLRVDDEVVRVRRVGRNVRCPRQSEQVGVVLLLLEAPVEPLRRRPTARSFTRRPRMWWRLTQLHIVTTMCSNDRSRKVGR